MAQRKRERNICLTGAEVEEEGEVGPRDRKGRNEHILVWNVCGFNEPTRAREATAILSDNKVGLCALLETKVKKTNFSRIQKGMDSTWLWMENYDSDESTRIFIGWNPSLYMITKLRESNQFIHILAFNSSLNLSFYVTFFLCKQQPLG